jgi:pyrrolidone-carboxylate peptidase
LKTEADTDNIFGPIDREGGWKSSAEITWLTTQANRYVDADPAFKQMMRTGTAVEQGGRVLFYASVTDSDTNSSHEFVPIRGLTDGVSDRDSCFDERGLFGAFDLDYDVVEDQGNTVRTLSLTQRPEEGYPPTNAMLLGLSEAQVNDLKALTGLSTDYKRMVVLRNRTAETDPAGNTYDRYEVGLQGLKADGTFHEVKPTSVIHVFSVDGRFFYSADFSDGEPLPTAYSRSFEESEGTRTRPAEERRIAAVDTGADEIRIANYDWTREIAPGDTVKVGKSSANDGDYTVDTVSMDGPDTVIEVQESIGSNADPLGSVFTTPKPYEDLFIDMDREGTLGGIDAMRTLVENFKSALGGVANNAGAQGNLESEVDDAAPEILRRAALLAQQDRTRADDYERALYWARIQMLVALKSHDFCLQSLSGRNALVNRFDRLSRGYDVDFSAAPGTAKKILVTGFDPFDLAFNPTATNPSSAVALALRSTGIASGDGWVESAIFPVRYEDFDAGRIETLVNPFLDGPNRVDAIVTLGQNGSLRYFDLERFAGKRRGGYSDNAQPGTVAAEQIGDGDAFYETTLPPEMVPGPFLGPPDQRIYFDESYESEDGSHPHPSAGGRNDHVQTFPLADISGAAREGSAGNDLSNEIFYRVAHRREELGSATRTGHLQVPGSDMDIQELIRLTEEMLERAVNLLP